MRILIHTLVAVMILGILGGVTMSHLAARQKQSDRGLARTELRRFQRQIHLQGALMSDHERQDQDGPPSIDPAWFKDNRPVNPLLGPEHPWVEVAGPRDRSLTHPPSLTATGPDVASFWYNPALAIVRARVPAGISDAIAHDLYNEINETAVVGVLDQKPR